MREIDLAVHDITIVAFDEAKAILTRRRTDLDKGVELLLTKEAITSNDFPPIGKAVPDGRRCRQPSTNEALKISGTPPIS